jgi:Leucine-rich repeat (LRR) protein
MYEVLTLQNLKLSGVGLVHLDRIKELFPNLVYLDVRDNKIYSFDIIEHLRQLEDFADINLIGNPICIHKHLKDEILQYMPNIEIVNGEEVH